MTASAVSAADVDVISVISAWTADRSPDSGDEGHGAETLQDEAVSEVRITRQLRNHAADDECFEAQSSCSVSNRDSVPIRK